jgi:hypothetical protein
MTTESHETGARPAARELGVVLAEFAQTMSEEQTTEAVLSRLGDYCTELLPVEGVGVLLADGHGNLMVGTANSEMGQLVEQLEADLHEGPCTSCVESGQPVPVPDLAAATDRFPRFAPPALDAGVRALYALPMTVRSEVIASLNIVLAEPGPLGAEELATAQLLADVGISYIANSRLLNEKSALAEQLQRALDSRILLEQAKGALAERHRISLDEAFERLRSHARSKRQKVHEAAREVLAGEVEL